MQRFTTAPPQDFTPEGGDFSLRAPADAVVLLADADRTAIEAA
jgi:hypothetical protein